MTTFVWRKGKWVEKARSSVSGIQVVRDIGAYVSPVCDASGAHPLIDGRAAQREDLKRNGCRVKEPSERLSVAGVPQRPEPRVTEAMMRHVYETYDRVNGR